ncbi:unnamed protein product [Gongylonema pulchrum]|uniref:Uncharacterized protein n=1 Tax=Gongylonema pulchrum TaxID=637853 RepID=A0A3P6TCU1_9BILA|nr:unnamed protein product [Gongylonema pulchrum]
MMEYYGALTVAALWGITNTLIRRAICIQPYVEHSSMC